MRLAILLILLLTSTVLGKLPRIAAQRDKLVENETGRTFTPWGFNYDRDYKKRLIEDYWIAEWETVESDFREMKGLGANIVRIHLSVSQFLDSPTDGNAKNVGQLKRLVKLCEELGLYLDVTGLGCYRKEAVPTWYSRVGEHERWEMQAKFWEVVAETCAGSTAVAWYDLANEPAVPGEKLKPGEWLAGHLADYWYCQFITLDPAGRSRGEIARAWVKRLSAAIRKYDREALVTVGMLPFSSEEGKESIGVDPTALKDLLDLICVHIYPKSPPYTEAISLCERFDRGKPLVIEEIFPLECMPQDLPGFFKASAKHVDGWIGFYWGQTPADLAPSTQPADALTRAWLNVFRTTHPPDFQVRP